MRILVATLLALSLPALAHAEYNDFVELEMASWKVAIQTPPWSNAGFHHIHTEKFYATAPTSNGGELHLTEFIPKGEIFGEQGEMYGGWSRLYAIALQTKVRSSAEEVMANQLWIYQNACEEMDWQRTRVSTQTVETFVTICTAFKDKPETGEISFFYIKVEDEFLLKNYYHIRTPRIDSSNFPSSVRKDEATEALNDIFKMLMVYEPPRMD